MVHVHMICDRPDMKTHTAHIIPSPTHPSTAGIWGVYSCMCIIITRYGSGGWYSSRSRNLKLSAEKCWHSSDQGSNSEPSGWKVKALSHTTSLLSTWRFLPSICSHIYYTQNELMTAGFGLSLTLYVQTNKCDTVTWCNTVTYQKKGRRDLWQLTSAFPVGPTSFAGEMPCVT